MCVPKTLIKFSCKKKSQGNDVLLLNGQYDREPNLIIVKFGPDDGFEWFGFHK